MKGNTLRHLLKVTPLPPPVSGVPSNETLKIKFEVDTLPPSGATYENKYGFLPSPYSVRLYDVFSLFAGKIQAVLCRVWKNRIKGRDFYDYVWYLSRGVKVKLVHLQKKLGQTGNWKSGKPLTLTSLKWMLSKRFKNGYATPDDIGSPADELGKITDVEYQKVQGSKAIAPFLNLDGSNTSVSFNMLVSGIKKLIQINIHPTI